HLIERIHHLAALAMVRHILEVIEKCDCFEKRPTVWCHVVHSHPPLNESRGSTSIRRFSDSSRTSSPDCPGEPLRTVDRVHGVPVGSWQSQLSVPCRAFMPAFRAWAYREGERPCRS